MALQRPLTKALACHNCQQLILRSFISSVGGQLTRPREDRCNSRRPFCTTQRRQNEALERPNWSAKDEEYALNDFDEEFAAPSSPAATGYVTRETPKQSQSEHVPWYLQVQEPIERFESPLAARQQVPQLPEHAPPILQPLLEHVSMELGIDDINLLDLRSLDPPPALGANLLMIVGTARSEKHLHISADRLCRWLRSTYHLSPHADGLLGRNELKLKLKRRAKRSKLLSAVGAKATAQTEIDDGIRTGWVCVNVGRVEGGDLPGREKRMENIVGFGPDESGSSIVVQMMTEEKRGEIDLESLWEESLMRTHKKERVEKHEQDGEEVSEERSASNQRSESEAVSEPSASAGSNAYHALASTSSRSAGQQIRAYHTFARRMQATIVQQSEISQDSPIALRHLSTATSTTSPEIDKLAAMVAELKSMEPRQARRLLGQNPLGASQQLTLHTIMPDVQTDSTPLEETPFLRSFYASMPDFPGPEHWHQHIELLAHARRVGVHEVRSTVLMAQLMNMQIAGLLPEERTFELVIGAALAPMGTMSGYDGVENIPTEGELCNILAVLEDMETCGYDPVSPDILKILYRACIGPAKSDATFELNSVVQQLGLARLTRLAREGDWPSFWRTWRSYPQRFLPRTAGMYAVLFSALAQGQLAGVRETMEVLRSSLQEMEREQPAVILEEHSAVSEAAAKALEYVEPGLKGSSAGDGSGASGEWKQWYDRCT